MPPNRGGSKKALWEPSRALLPVELDQRKEQRKAAKAEQFKAQLAELYAGYDRGCICDTDVPPSTDLSVIQRPCSAEFLDILLKDLDNIAEAECNALVTTNPDETKAKIAKVTTEGNRLVRHPELFVDDQARQEFLVAYLGRSKRLRDIIIEKRRLQKRSLEKDKAQAGQATHDETGFRDDLPRWTQFLGKDAPGAARLGLDRVLTKPSTAYQVIPEGGINILKQWDNAQRKEYELFSQSNGPNHPMWTRRVDWRARGLYKTKNGSHAIDPMQIEPSPWPKQNAGQMEQWTMGQAQGQTRESLESLSEFAAQIRGHSNGPAQNSFRFVVSSAYVDEARRLQKDGKSE